MRLKFSCLAGDQIGIYNVVLLGLGFCFTFAGFNTMGGIQTLVFDSAKNPDSGGFVEGYNGNGFWSLAISYLAFTFGNILAPSIVATIGPRATLVVSSLSYVFYILQLLVLNDGLLYFASVVLGLGSALYWTAQGNFLALNSTESTIARNSGIFWAMFASSGIIGNLIVYTQFRGKEFIDTDTRNIVGGVLIGLGGAATLVMLALAPPGGEPDGANTQQEEKKGPIKALKDSGKLLLTRDMLLLAFTFFYTGLQLNIWSAVYNTCLGFTSNFGDERKGLAVISGIFIGLGEVLAGGAFGIFGQFLSIKRKMPIIILGFVCCITAYILIFINIPKEAPFGETDIIEHVSFIEPNKYVAMVASFFLGFSDACFNTQILSLLGDVYKKDSTSAFAIYKFFQVAATSIAFWYSPVIHLYWQLLIATIFCTLGSISFIVVEVLNKNKLESVKKEEQGAENPAYSLN